MSDEDDMGVRGEATTVDLLAAVKLAVASEDIADKARAFDLIAWIVDLHEPGERPKSVDLFIKAIEQTRREPQQRPDAERRALDLANQPSFATHALADAELRP